MAEAGFRFQQQSGPNPYYFNQQHHHSRHIARNGSPVNSSRGAYPNDTPSPSRSPVSQSSSHLPYNMYGHGQLHSHGMLMNAGGHQRYQNMGMGQKFQHQNHQQHNGHANHHHHQVANVSAVGHQQSFSSGAISHGPPSYHGNVSNGQHTNEQLEVNGNYAQHWQQQIQYANESRQGAQHPHRHCKGSDAVRLLSRASLESQIESKLEDSKEERNRASVTDVTRRQDWDALDFSGQGLKAISRPVFSQFTFLRKLYLDHNQLHRLDPAIGCLRLLTHLDVSGNNLAEVPPEIGMLVNLRCFLIFDNQITALPTEIGHLFRLEVLGIEGNPLAQDVKSHIVEHGTQSFIEFVREKLLGVSPHLFERYVKCGKLTIRNSRPSRTPPSRMASI